MRRMQKITGRSDDMMIIRGVNVFPSQIEELILQRPLLAPHYVCEIDKDGPLDRLTVRVELKAGEHTDGSAAAGAQAALEHAIKSLIGVSCRVRVEPAGAIERSIGKAKRVVDRRPR
jgi:phenylacetate-CoA ligase